MAKFSLIFILFFVLVFSAQANVYLINDTLLIENSTLSIAQENEIFFVDETQKEVKFKRGKAIVLTILTGFLGGHRIYLGTHQRTPIIYSVTFGGFGILPLIDLVHLIFIKDISIYENNTQIMMWRKE
ncbi:MAG: TM2 domain-containing protein [Flavobacteriales bacterium]|nr:TM2 domain-containing protein [Flavobacteriales bacterium]NCT16229.1 TM2 domain-containing protein [Flavobacteriales bacterium]